MYENGARARGACTVDASRRSCTNGHRQAASTQCRIACMREPYRLCPRAFAPRASAWIVTAAPASIAAASRSPSVPDDASQCFPSTAMLLSAAGTSMPLAARPPLRAPLAAVELVALPPGVVRSR